MTGRGERVSRFAEREPTASLRKTEEVSSVKQERYSPPPSSSSSFRMPANGQKKHADTKRVGSSSKSPTKNPLDEKKEEWTKMIADRLMEDPWYEDQKKEFADRLLSYQSSQLVGNEKKVMEDLIKQNAASGRQNMPEDIKRDLLVLVKEFLESQSDKTLRSFDSPPASSGRTSK